MAGQAHIADGATCAGDGRLRRVASQPGHMTCRPVRLTNGSPQRLQSGVAIVSLPSHEMSPPVSLRSFASAEFSICLTRSLVIPICAPISSSVMPAGCLLTASLASWCTSHSRSAHGSGMCAGARPRRLATTGGVLVRVGKCCDRRQAVSGDEGCGKRLTLRRGPTVAMRDDAVEAAVVCLTRYRTTAVLPLASLGAKRLQKAACSFLIL